MISDLYRSGMTISEISSEYSIAKLKKEMARIKEENEILKKAMAIFEKED